jgi:hypothetical protein
MEETVAQHKRLPKKIGSAPHAESYFGLAVRPHFADPTLP